MIVISYPNKTISLINKTLPVDIIVLCQDVQQRLLNHFTNLIIIAVLFYA